jgi:hypothetical protein
VLLVPRSRLERVSTAQRIGEIKANINERKARLDQRPQDAPLPVFRYFPAPNSYRNVLSAFLLDWRDAPSLATTAKPTQP